MEDILSKNKLRKNILSWTYILSDSIKLPKEGDINFRKKYWSNSKAGLHFHFWWQKRIAFESSLDDCYFVIWLIDYFDLPRYVSESTKRSTLTLLMMLLGRGFVGRCKWKWIVLKRAFPDVTWSRRILWLFSFQKG